MLERGPHDRRGPFGPKRQAPAAAVYERIHFLFDDVGRIADAAYEEFGRLENRRANLAVAEPIGERADPRFERAPAAGFGSDEVLRSAGRGERLRLHSLSRSTIQNVGACTIYVGIRALAIAYRSDPSRPIAPATTAISGLRFASCIARPTA